MLKRLRKKFKNGSDKLIIFLWIFSYLVIFAVASLSNILLFSRTSKAMEKESETEYQRTINETILSVDGLLENISNFHTSVTNNEKFKQLCREPENGSSDLANLKVDFAELSRYLALYQRSSVFSTVYIKFNYLGSVVTDNFFGSYERFYEKFYTDSNISFENWNKITSAQSFGNCRRITTADGSFLEFMYQIPLHSNSHVTATMVFRLSSDYFNAANTFRNSDNSANFAIINSDNAVLYSGNSSRELAPSSYADYGSEFDIIRRKKNIEIYGTSSVTQWKFIFIVPKHIFEKNMIHVKRLNLLQLLIASVICIAIAFYFSRKNSRPLMELAGIYRKNFGKPLNINSSYEFVNTIIADYADSKKNLKRIENEKINTLKNQYYCRLLQSFETVQKPPECDDFISDSFSVVVFRIEKSLNASFPASEDDENLNFFIVQNVMEELLGGKNICRIFRYYDKIVAIINYAEGKTNGKTLLENAYSSGCSFIEDNFNFSFSVFSSCIVSGQHMLPIAYKEAQFAMNVCENLKLDNTIAFFEDTAKQILGTNSDNYNAYIEHESFLFDYIKNGDFLGASNTLPKMLKPYGLSGALSSALIFYIGTKIHGIIPNSLKEDPDSKLAKLLTDTAKYSESAGLGNSIYKLLQLACESCKTVSDSGENSANDIFTKALDHIRQYYTNSEMNVFSIGKHFDMSPYYISRVFKKQTGQNMGDYINKLRIEKSKELIRTTKLPISDIWPLTGFCNEKTFVRNFVKFESVTPAKYRELYH